MCVIMTGCETLRFAPDEIQKKNAWLHNRTTELTSQTATQQDASAQLQELAKLSEKQSRAFVSYFGQPVEYPQADTAEEGVT